MNKLQNEKRRLPRLLCPDNFSHAVVEYNNDLISATSINFHRYGLAIFYPERIECPVKCVVSFELRLNDGSIRLEKLPGTILYGFETEVGNQYGIKFDMDMLDETSQINLVSIEEHVLALTNDIQRWKAD